MTEEGSSKKVQVLDEEGGEETGDAQIQLVGKESKEAPFGKSMSLNGKEELEDSKKSLQDPLLESSTS